MTRRLPRPLAALALALALAACSDKEAAPTPIRPVLTQVVGQATAPAVATYSGEVRARVETALAFRVPGKIVSRRVDVGARVHAGQELARLDPADQALGASGADAQLAAARAELAFAKAELHRYAGLREKNFVSQAALEQKKAAFEAAHARVDALQAQAQLSRRQSDYTVLRADSAGVISQVTAEVGQVVGAGQMVLRLAREEGKEVAISVPESRMAELQQAGLAEVSLWSQQGTSKVFGGRIREVAPVADPVTRTYPVRVSIDKADASVLLGMTANVRFQAKEGTAAITIPLAAVFQQEGKPAVWIVADGGKIALRPVTVASFTEGGARLSAGLKPGERIVTAGVHKLIPGETVKVQEAGSSN